MGKVKVANGSKSKGGDQILVLTNGTKRTREAEPTPSTEDGWFVFTSFFCFAAKLLRTTGSCRPNHVGDTFNFTDFVIECLDEEVHCQK